MIHINRVTPLITASNPKACHRHMCSILFCGTARPAAPKTPLEGLLGHH